MICFPNAKINLGLQVALKRADGFHNLRSVFYPLPLYDVLEFKEADKYSLTVWKSNENLHEQDNLITKAWKMVAGKYGIPAQEIHLIKNIPSGSGLGGGSADAVFFLKEIISFYNLPVTSKELQQMAAELCSDCSFFINNRPAYVIGRGNVVEPLDFSLKGLSCVLVFPETKISTKNAFQKITPKVPQYNLKKLVLENDFEKWRKQLTNDFESVLPESLFKIKQKLYDAGALYASLTGSGSAFYGLFEKPVELNFDKAETVVLELKH